MKLWFYNTFFTFINFQFLLKVLEEQPFKQFYIFAEQGTRTSDRSQKWAVSNLEMSAGHGCLQVSMDSIFENALSILWSELTHKDLYISNSFISMGTLLGSWTEARNLIIFQHVFVLILSPLPIIITCVCIRFNDFRQESLALEIKHFCKL